MANSKWIASRALLIVGVLCLSLNTPLSATENNSVHATALTVTDDELTKIDKLLDQTMEQVKHNKYSGRVFPILSSLKRLTQLQTLYPSAPTIDRVLFLTVRAKIAMGVLIDAKPYLTSEEQIAVDSYRNKHGSEYLVGLGVAYKGGELTTLTTKFQNSPFAPEVAFLMAMEETKMGECESDVDCYIGRVLDAYLPYLQNYPGHQKNRMAVEEINREFERVTLDPQKNGLWELYNLDSTTILLKKYCEVVKTIADADLRAEALYSLARVFISAGEFKLADAIYNDLETHNTAWRDARKKAAQLMFDFNEAEPAPTPISNSQEVKEIAKLSSSSEADRISALNKFYALTISDHTFLFKLLLILGDMAEHDSSAIVRKLAVDVIEHHAAEASFFRSVIGYCLSYEPDKGNKYNCAKLTIANSTLRQSELYNLNRDKINSLIAEVESNSPQIIKINAEKRAEYLGEVQAFLEQSTSEAKERGHDADAYKSDMASRSNARFVRLFGTDYIFIVNSFRLEIVIPLWCFLMLLCGVLSYKNASNKSLDKRFWLVVGALTAPLTLLYIYFIPKKK